MLNIASSGRLCHSRLQAGPVEASLIVQLRKGGLLFPARYLLLLRSRIIVDVALQVHTTGRLTLLNTRAS